MQAVETVPRAADANYRTRTRVASQTMSADDVSAIYPPPSLDVMYRQSMSFPIPILGRCFRASPWRCHALA